MVLNHWLILIKSNFLFCNNIYVLVISSLFCRHHQNSNTARTHTRGDDDTRTSRRAARNVGARHARTRSAARPRRATTRECFGLSVFRKPFREPFNVQILLSSEAREAFRERLDEKRIHRDQSLARSTLNPTLHPVSRATRCEPASGNDVTIARYHKNDSRHRSGGRRDEPVVPEQRVDAWFASAERLEHLHGRRAAAHREHRAGELASR